MQIDLPAIFNDWPTRRSIAALDGIIMVGIATKIARNIYTRCRLAEAQNWKCCWCGIECRPEPGFSDSATIEHVQPRSLGGADHWDNFAMACANCNHKRGAISVEDFMAGHIPVKRTKSKTKEERSERVLRKRMRKYRRHIERFNSYGWMRNDKPYCPYEWLNTLRISPESVAELRVLIEV